MSMFQSVSIPTGFVTKTYSPSDEDLINPERGWWKFKATKASDYTVLPVSRLQTFRSEGHTLIFRYYVLDLFVHSDISASFLTNLQDDLENARVAGVKIIPRFCYTLTAGESTDAPLTQALRHVAQLKPYLQANGDVIAVVQAGFIGTWGRFRNIYNIYILKYISRQVSQLRRYRSEGHTLIFRYYVLDLFVHSDISASFLTNLQDDLENARVAGVKIIPRFCYTETSGDSDDASLSRALRHLSQLKPYLQANGDVIAVVQAGFIGTWGEWYYSDSFSTPDSDGDPVVVTDNDWAKRSTLMDAILDAVPNNRMVQVRTMKYKRRLTDDVSPLTQSEAHSGSKKARIGHHNDCFLASDKDWGTFQDLTEDYAYLSADTKYTVMGGETCNYNPPRSSCATAEQELALFHWSYLNPGFKQDVTDEWKQQGCFDRIGRHLGYRLELVSGTYRNAVPQGGTFCGRLEIRNVGYAAPFNPRQVRVVLQKDSAIVTSLLVTGVDPRDWHPGTLHSVPISVQLPSNLAAGSYEVSLWLPDPSPTISDRPEFSILLANTGVPDPLTGLNSLGHTLEVQPTGSDSSSC
ncbi:uncharacterized protein LOC118421762 [Branchiostoma floridae]|uniref:Uncharacterized protein LOC118421762 n=1 Tax=Branchiostoma floridae TaxID=7739 RepID=A0A9J7MXH7_BRAFL|nr:uncharacterized protein LOC118421762 [Branchiostoma floridae]